MDKPSYEEIYGKKEERARKMGEIAEDFCSRLAEEGFTVEEGLDLLERIKKAIQQTHIRPVQVRGKLDFSGLITILHCSEKQGF